MSYVIILEMCEGNESVGSMWNETAIVDESTPVKQIVEWAFKKTHQDKMPNPVIRQRLMITIPQDI